MSDFVKRLFASNDFMPQGHCYLWQPQIVLLHAISDALLAVACSVISLALIVFVRRRRDIPFRGVFVCFAVFIAASAATHYLDVWTLWSPLYRFSGLVKAIAAAVSIVTAAVVMRPVRKPAPTDSTTSVSGRA
jgi:hypothetical protein